MKRASVQVAAVWMDCPHCGAGFTNSDGSLMIEHGDSMFTGGNVLTCPSCGKRSKVPVLGTVRGTSKGFWAS